jgi:multidrug efflux pump subunit AcrA (membrane-fusion protein)
LAGLAAAAAVAIAVVALRPARSGNGPRSGQASTATIARRDFVRAIRLSGTVEAVQATTISAPRLSGPNTNSLVITKLVRAGSMVKPGDLLVEFDRQVQLQTALDRRAELSDLEQQIRRKAAESSAARARDDSELQQAESALARAELEMLKNPMIARILAEKNEQALEEAKARLAQLKKTYDLKRLAAEADLKVLVIRKDKAENAMRQAETNAMRMEIHSPIQGLAVIRTVWKTSNMSEILEGEEIRAGVPVVDIVNPAMMRVRARVNQADVNELRVDQPVKVGLDAYPDLSFAGRVSQISPIAATSTLNPKVRNFIVLIEVQGSHPNLMPDLTASLDVELAREAGTLVVPRDAIRVADGRATVRVKRGETFDDRIVTLGSMNAHEIVIASGLDDGAVVARNVAQ